MEITEIELMSKVQTFLGRTHASFPCWKIVDELYTVPLIGAEEVQAEVVQVGDVVIFGDNDKTLCPDYSIGVYLGNGKVVTSFKEIGCVLIPWRFVKQTFVGGLRSGQRG